LKEHPATALGSLDKHPVKYFVAIVMIAIGILLATDAKRSPRNRSQPAWTDFLFAMDTDSKRTIFNATKSRPDVSQKVRVTVEIAYGEVSLRSVLYFIQRIRALLDNDSISIANDLFQLRLPAHQECFKFVQFGFRHSSFSAQLAVDLASLSLQCVVHACFQPAK
jgi:hypothetical protein